MQYGKFSVISNVSALVRGIFPLLVLGMQVTLQAAEPAAPELQPVPPTLLGNSGLTVNGRIQPHGAPGHYYFEYGPTAELGQKTEPQPLAPQLTAYYHETWDEGWNGWRSWDARLLHFPEGGARKGYIEYGALSRDDHNHDDGVGTVHLAQYMYPGSSAPIPAAYMSAGDPDFRDARIRIGLRGRDWQPNGTELMWWSQSQSNIEINPNDQSFHPDYRHANWCYTGTGGELTDLLATGKWEQAEYRLVHDSNMWSYCGNRNSEKRYEYWQIDDTQRHLNLDYFHMVVFVNPQQRPTGAIDFDEFEVAYRNYSLAFAGNGGKLIRATESDTDPAVLTDGWRNGEGKMWQSAANPQSPQEFMYEFAQPVTIQAVQLHQNPEWPAGEVEVLITTDGQQWQSLFKKPMPPPHEAGANFTFLLERKLDAPAKQAKVRIHNGAKAEHWGLGEIEFFGTGATYTTDDDWYHVNLDVTRLPPGKPCFYRLVAETSAGTTVGPTESYELPAETRPETLLRPASRVTATSAKVEGRLNPLGLKTEFHFEYGPDANLGQKSEVQYGGLQITPRSAFVTLSNLEPGQTYHYRLVATNATGTSHSEIGTFTTTAK